MTSNLETDSCSSEEEDCSTIVECVKPKQKIYKGDLVFSILVKCSKSPAEAQQAYAEICEALHVCPARYKKTNHLCFAARKVDDLTGFCDNHNHKRCKPGKDSTQVKHKCKMCAGKTGDPIKGNNCRNHALKGEKYCNAHINCYEKKLQEARAKQAPTI